MAMDDDATASELSELLAALAAGVRAVKSLPVDDEFQFQSSFPEFSQALQSASQLLLETLNVTFESLPSEDDDILEDFDDPAVWEKCADAIDALMDHVEANLQHANPKQITQLQHFSDLSRDRAKTKYGTMMAGLVVMEKPQSTYQIHVQNSRTEPFVPPLNTKPHAVVPLDLSFKEGHGLETRFGDLRKQVVPSYIVAPSKHVPHVYEHEIRSFSYRPDQLIATKPKTPKITRVDPLQATWIDSESALQDMVRVLERSRELAIDLEAHSYHSFGGLVCLMQLSVRGATGIDNYLVDTLKLHTLLNRYLQPIFTDPEIVKVMHGADSDIPWLQRDFGLYVVNLFDTGRAARALNFTSAGYAHLLQRYVDVVADKSHQLADWRQRPLTRDMQQYAISDTHYLLDIYERLKWELQQSKDTGLLQQVLDVSRQVCLIRYAVEPFKPDGYKVLLSKRNSKLQNDLNEFQERVLKGLWDWRDRVARERDESPTYICDNRGLLRIAMSSRTVGSVRALQGLFNPLPPLVLQHSQDIIDIVKAETMKEKEQEVGDEDYEDELSAPGGAPSSAFFKPANKGQNALRRRSRSPILATEALYAQAGWMTPQEKSDRLDEVQTTSADDEDTAHGPSQKPKRLLSVHAANKNYRSQQHSDHSMEFGDGSRGRSVDGLETVRVAREHSQSPVSQSIEEEMKLAKQTSMQIRGNLAQKSTLPAVLGLITPIIDVDDDDGVDESLRNRDGAVVEEEDFPIPRSMREIYKISNRNRRNKKTGSPTPERGHTPTTEKERLELEKAEALLRERGLLDSGYFVDSSGLPGKRPKVKTSSGRDSEESVPLLDPNATASREEDLAVLRDLGWIQPGTNLEAGGVSHPPGAHATYGFDYGAAQGVGGLDPATQSSNPFFAGAAMTGGPLTQGTDGTGSRPSKRSGPNKGRQHRRQERPDKKDGRSFSYRKR